MAIERAYDLSKKQSGEVLQCMKLKAGLDKFMKIKADPVSKKKLGSKQFALDAQPYHDYREHWAPSTTNRKNAKDRGSYDEKNDPPVLHDRRLLLFAECQIGKTGAYTCLLHLLRKSCEAERPCLPVILPFLNKRCLVTDSLRQQFLWTLPHWAKLTQQSTAAGVLSYSKLKLGK